MALKARQLTAATTQELSWMAHSRTAPHSLVQRARMSWANVQGLQAPAIAQQVGVSALRVRAWIHRFNRHGMVGLANAPRSGRPRRRDEAARGRLIAPACPKPPEPRGTVALWMLARLRQALRECHGLEIAPATIWKWL